jgi:uncharacterized protein
VKAHILPAQIPESMTVLAPLSEEEMNELDRFLMSDATSNETMMLACLDGFLTAIASGPVMLKPGEWLPRVWGPTEEDAPTFDSKANAERITDLIMRHLNGIIWNLHQDTDHFEPVFDINVYTDDAREYVDGEMWAHGYMSAIDLQRESWKPVFESRQGLKMLQPIQLLGAADITPEEEELVKTPTQREELTNQIPASIGWIYKFWAPHRRAVAERTNTNPSEQENPMQGRNAPCSCGSGRKFKKCCGASTEAVD